MPINCEVEDRVLVSFGHVADVEVVGLAGLDAVPLAQQRRDLVDGLGICSADDRLDRDLVDVGEADRLRRVGRLGRRRDGIQRRGSRGRGCSSVLTWLAAPPADAALWLASASVAPLTRYLIVVQGASTMSSWSMPIMFAPLRLEHADHPEGDVLDADLLADGRFVLEQLALEGLADHADLAARCARRGR